MNDITPTRDEQESRLWEASRNYLKGEIGVRELEKIERLETQDLRKALISLARRTRKKTGNYVKRWTDENECDLWRFSRMYMDGNIDVIRLEQAELPYTKLFKKAIISLAKRSIKWRFLDLLFIQRRNYLNRDEL